MPTIYKYLGMVMMFYSDEHEPIHIHIKYGNTMAIIEFYIVEGIITDIKWRKKRGIEMLPQAKMKDVERFIKEKQSEIIEKWVDFFIKKKNIKPQTITKKIK